MLLADIISALKLAVQEKRFGAAPTRRLISALLLLLFLFVLSLAQFESLHQTLHPDSSEPGHSCAVTLLRSGQVDAAPAVPVTAAAPAPVPTAAPCFACPVFVSFEFTLLPSCGPPALLS